MILAIYIKLSDRVWQDWQTAKDFANQKVDYLTNSAQTFGQSLQETATTTTDKTIDAVTQTLNQSWQNAEQVKSMTSTAIQTVLTNPTSGINSAFNNWLVQHPTLWRLVQILDWAANHPIISLVVLLFGLTLIWSIIKAVMSLIERASWSILQVPLKLIQAVINFSFFFLLQIFNSVLQKSINHQPAETQSVLSDTVHKDKPQRLAEISLRLEAIQQEQQELLQEAATLIATNDIDIKMPELTHNS
ncbi:hypothetical protein H6G36_09465 [Anabaena minutissima FACHB-250]|nr:hypothetical protein [Anabaena minutissima FACHB-250]